jgi:hypothetical protein
MGPQSPQDRVDLIRARVNARMPRMPIATEIAIDPFRAKSYSFGPTGSKLEEISASTK